MLGRGTVGVRQHGPGSMGYESLTSSDAPGFRGLEGLEKGVKSAGGNLGGGGGLKHLTVRVFFCDGFRGLGVFRASGWPEKNLKM